MGSSVPLRRHWFSTTTVLPRLMPLSITRYTTSAWGVYSSIRTLAPRPDLMAADGSYSLFALCASMMAFMVVMTLALSAARSPEMRLFFGFSTEVPSLRSPDACASPGRLKVD